MLVGTNGGHYPDFEAEMLELEHWSDACPQAFPVPTAIRDVRLPQRPAAFTATANKGVLFDLQHEMFDTWLDPFPLSLPPPSSIYDAHRQPYPMA
jgi:hypothetical protein